MKMYRQRYCGCIYSEKERFFKPAVRHSKKVTQSL
jgi:predicted adenine nucleotide alpha hydrolase (AANH) superfamily ATPase